MVEGLFSLILKQDPSDFLDKIGTLEDIEVKINSVLDQDKNGKFDKKDIGILVIKGLISLFVVFAIFLLFDREGLVLMFNFTMPLTDDRWNTITKFVIAFLAIFGFLALDYRNKKKEEVEKLKQFLLTIEKKIAESKLLAKDTEMQDKIKDLSVKIDRYKQRLALNEIMITTKDVAHKDLFDAINNLYESLENEELKKEFEANGLVRENLEVIQAETSINQDLHQADLAHQNESCVDLPESPYISKE